MRNHGVFDDVTLDRIPRRCMRFGDMHRAAADDGAATRTGTEFRQGHPHRHERHFLVAGVVAVRRFPSGDGVAHRLCSKRKKQSVKFNTVYQALAGDPSFFGTVTGHSLVNVPVRDTICVIRASGSF
jgi:hypothetical protein